VGIQDVGKANGLIYLVMDLVDGPSLSQSLEAKGPYEIRSAVRLMCQILAGLKHAHTKGFVHRDIKPSNILIGAEGDNKKVAKLADFGLARVFEASQLSGVTMQGELVGTPAYIAPEQVTHYRDVKPAADQYSAAATLYKLLTGQDTRDFPKDLGAALGKIVTTHPVPIRDRRPDLPSELAVAIHKALSRDPEERYPDITFFRDALRLFA
jgi:serine/threonine protein kinase